jgi:hypothetical protein
MNTLPYVSALQAAEKVVNLGSAVEERRFSAAQSMQNQNGLQPPWTLPLRRRSFSAACLAAGVKTQRERKLPKLRQ